MEAAQKNRISLVRQANLHCKEYLMELDRLCTEYLRSVNPIAQRIAEDLENIHNASKDKWGDLDDKARQKVIDDNLIDAQLVLKYQDEVREDPDMEPLSSFSWFTKSQLDLFTLIDVKPSIKTPVRKAEVLSPLKKGKDTVDNKDIGIVNRIKLKVMKSPPVEDNRSDTKQHSKTLPKPRMPPPPPPPKRSSNSENSALLSGSTSQDDIPKTGFDFLDNW